VGWVNCIDAKPPRYYEKQSAKAIFLKPRHCEKRRSNLSQSPSLREAKRRGNQHPPLVIARSEATWQSIFQVVQDSRWIASPSARNDVGWLAMIRVLVIARSKATWQSIFQGVQDSRWIASPLARNDDGGWLAKTVKWL